MMAKGRLIGFPVVNLKFTITDGQSHSVDSSDVAFQEAARGAFREAYDRAKPVILEPIMRVGVEGPLEFQGSMTRTVMQRRGVITGTTDMQNFCRIEADVPLAEMFAYSNVLRSATQGKGEFTMEFAKYARVPEDVSLELRERYAKR
jgi:elongation factor G